MLAPERGAVKQALMGVIVVAQVAIPSPVGYVNDFAHILDTASVAHMGAVCAEVREKTQGEIAVVTLPDLAGREASDMAVEIGRRWGVGAKGDAGDPAKNLGVVILLVPRHNHQPGTGAIFIATGRGAEGFLPDSRVGRIRDAIAPALAREEYGAGLAQSVDLVAQAFAAQFGVTLSGVPVASPSAQDEGPVGPTLLKLLFFLLVLLVLTRGRLLLLPFLFGGLGGGRGSWGGGGGWGGGGFGGGFGGFGGGGGFSGGGAGGRF